MSGVELATLILATIGVLFMLVSAYGILRLPDVLSRMHAVGKASTLGASCILIAAGIFFGGNQLLRVIALIVLFFITAPVASTAMSRAAHRALPADRFVLESDELAEYLKAQGEK